MFEGDHAFDVLVRFPGVGIHVATGVYELRFLTFDDAAPESTSGVPRDAAASVAASAEVVLITVDLTDGEEKTNVWVIKYTVGYTCKYLPQPIEKRSSHRKNNTHSYNILYCRTQYRHMSFFPWTIPEWNSLPQELVAAKFLDCFKSRLAAHL